MRDLTTSDDVAWRPATKRPVPVKAARIEEPFSVTTAEGAVMVMESGWLLEGDDGRRWAVDAAYFERHYTLEA